LSDDGKQHLTKFIQGLLNATENYETVARPILNLLVFMDRTEQPLRIPDKELIEASIRYGAPAYALHMLRQPFQDAHA
jgi:hypothetical protein